MYRKNPFAQFLISSLRLEKLNDRAYNSLDSTAVSDTSELLQLHRATIARANFVLSVDKGIRTHYLHQQQKKS